MINYKINELFRCELELPTKGIENGVRDLLYNMRMICSLFCHGSTCRVFPSDGMNVSNLDTNFSRSLTEIRLTFPNFNLVQIYH
jgi:hypothetical protein